MNEPKIPDNETDWHAIDIYLFSNGQQYSPPRKYHLQTDELTWWDATLSFLARSQLGYLHSSINLYTLNGNKVEGPMELGNGLAYVAVEPNDTFIPAGYDQYLMKASRSWEKRKEKRSSNIKITNQDEINVINEKAKSDINLNVEKLKSPHQSITAETATVLSVNDKTETVIKPFISNHGQKGITSEKQVNKKPLTLHHHNTIIRKNNKTPISSPQATIKNSVNKRECPPKKTFKLTSANNLRSSMDYRNNQQEAITKSDKVTPKTIYKSKQIVPSKIDDVITRKSPTRATSKETCLITNDTEIKNLNNEKEKITVFNKNKSIESEIFPILVNNGTPMFFPVMENKNQSKASLTPILMPSDGRHALSIEEPFTVLNNVYTPESLVQNKATSRSNSRHEAVNTLPKELSDNLGNTHTILNQDSQTAILKKEDIINLKLDIQIRNSSAIVKGEIKKRNAETIHLFNNELREKESQVNVDEDIYAMQSNTLRTILSELNQSQANQKILVIHCACNDLHHLNEFCKVHVAPTCNDNKKYVVLLTKPRGDEKLLRCNCGETNHRVDKEVQTTLNIEHNVINNIVDKIISHTSNDLGNTETEYLVVNNNNLKKNSTPPTLNITEEIKKNECTMTKRRVVISEGENTPAEYIVPAPITEELQKTELIMFKKDGCETISMKNQLNKSTQTEWCNIMLEARHHDGGRYTFHLPPLHVLRHYDLQNYRTE